MGRHKIEELIAFSKSGALQNIARYDVLESQCKKRASELLAFDSDYQNTVAASQQLIQLYNERERLRSVYDSVKQQAPAHFKLFTESSQKAENQAFLLEFYKGVLESLSKTYLDTLSGLLTDVYQTVYDTQKKRVQLEMADYRNKKVVRLNILNTCDSVEYSEEFDTGGGSEKIVLGIIVSIYVILQTGAPRIIFFDETLSAFSTPVLHRFLAILKRFTDEMGFAFVLVEHSAYRIKDYLNKIYTIDDGVYREVGPREWDLVFKRSMGEET